MNHDLYEFNFKSEQEALRFKDILRSAISFHKEIEKVRDQQTKKAAPIPSPLGCAPVLGNPDVNPYISAHLGAKIQRFHDFLGTVLAVEGESSSLSVEEIAEYYFRLFHEVLCDDDEETGP